MVTEAKTETTKYNSSSPGYSEYILSEYFAMREYEVQLLDEIERSGAPKNRITELEQIQGKGRFEGKGSRRLIRDVLPKEYVKIEQLRDQVQACLPGLDETLISIKEQLKSEHANGFAKAFEKVCTAVVYPEKLDEGDRARVIHRYPEQASRFYDQLAAQVLRLKALNKENIESAKLELKDIIEKNLKDMGYPTGVSLLVQGGELDAYLRDALAFYGANLWQLQKLHNIDVDGSLHEMVLKDVAVSLIKSRFVGIVLDLSRTVSNLEVPLGKTETAVGGLFETVFSSLKQPDVKKEEELELEERPIIPVAEDEAEVASEQMGLTDHEVRNALNDLEWLVEKSAGDQNRRPLRAIRQSLEGLIQSGVEIPRKYRHLLKLIKVQELDPELDKPVDDLDQIHVFVEDLKDWIKTLEEKPADQDSGGEGRQEPTYTVRPARIRGKDRFGWVKGAGKWVFRRKVIVPLALSAGLVGSSFCAIRYGADLWDIYQSWAVNRVETPAISPVVSYDKKVVDERLLACYKDVPSQTKSFNGPDERSMEKKSREIQRFSRLSSGEIVDRTYDPRQFTQISDLVEDLAPRENLTEDQKLQIKQVVAGYLIKVNEDILLTGAESDADTDEILGLRGDRSFLFSHFFQRKGYYIKDSRTGESNPGQFSDGTTFVMNSFKFPSDIDILMTCAKNATRLSR